MTPMQHTPSRAAMPKRRRATRPLYTVPRAPWPIITVRRRADTRGRESSVSTIPELNRTLLSTIWISRARDAPVQPGTPAASRPGRRKAPRAMLLSQASPGFPARPRSRRTLRSRRTAGSVRTPRSVRTSRSRRAKGPPGRCPAGCAGTPLRETGPLETGRSGPPALEPAHRACSGPAPARSGSSVPVLALIRSSRPAPEPSRWFLPAARWFLPAARWFVPAAELSRRFLPAPAPSPRGRA
jgi:hypothetical protein